MTAPAWASRPITSAARDFSGADALAFLRLVADPSAALELRGLPTPPVVRRVAATDEAAILLALSEMAGAGCAGVYYTLNPIPHRLDRAARDGDILRRRWLLIDVDPIYAEDHASATDEEKAGAMALADQVGDYLASLDWPDPALVDSGNGHQMIYRIDLPNDDESKAEIKAFLKRLAARFGETFGRIDPSVYNASRVAKLPGTWACKGRGTPERPHRMARLVSAPAEVGRVSLAMIREACADEPAEVSPVDADGYDVAFPPVLDTPPVSNTSPWPRLVAEPERGPADAGARRYALAALEREAAAVLSAKNGNRNNQLNTSACKIGHYVPHLLSEQEASDALGMAGLAAGLTPSETDRTIRSGMAKGRGEPKTPPAIPTSAPKEPPAEAVARRGVATAADLIEAGSRIEWLWEGWIARGMLLGLAGEPGCGKTRLLSDLARRVYLGLPWPDGSPPTLPPGSKVMWVASDNQHPELAELPGQMGFPPEVLLINAPPDSPYEGTTLDDADELKALEARIGLAGPVMVFIDTSTQATRRGVSKAEDAAAFFMPLAEIARHTGVPIVCVTHLNASGQALGKRILGAVRVMIAMDRPDPDGQPDRRKLVVVKNNLCKVKPPLGVTMHTYGNDYDDTPPAKPDDEPGKDGSGRRGAKKEAAIAWLRENLPGLVFELRRAWEADGHNTGTMYNAREALGVVEDEDGNGRKCWSLPTS